MSGWTSKPCAGCLFPHFINPGLYDWVVRCLAKADVPLSIVQKPAQLHSTLSLMAAGVGVLPSPFFLNDSGRADVVLRPLTGFGPGAQISATTAQGSHPPLRAFPEVLWDVVKEQSIGTW